MKIVVPREPTEEEAEAVMRAMVAAPHDGRRYRLARAAIAATRELPLSSPVTCEADRPFTQEDWSWIYSAMKRFFYSEAFAKMPDADQDAFTLAMQKASRPAGVTS